MINVGIFGEQKLMLYGLKRILNEVSDFSVVVATSNKYKLLEKAKNPVLHVLILHFFDASVRNTNLIVQLNITNPKMKILVVSNDNSQDAVLKIMKAKAKGFLGNDADAQDLAEAVYSLRNGFDYFNKSINRMVLNQYISNIQSDNPQSNDDVNSLSARQLEILKLWGKSYTNQEIAEELFISVRTVESHKNHIMQKLKLKTTVDLVKFSIQNNIIEI
jgi:two-component system response regulator NreC